MIKSQMLGTLLWTVFLLSPALSHAQVFQWTDARGVIHWTDNLASVPESVRASPGLIIRQDIAAKAISSEISSQPENASLEPPLQPKLPEAAIQPEPEQKTVAPPVIHYSPQNITIVVVNSVVQHPRKHPCPGPARCQPQVFRPNFEDRRYIHPSVFDGGSRQYIHPGLSQPPRK